MTLGEKIYKNRTRLNLSQGDLADMLEVSRQSVSKWENDAATPDLDKIIKLSEIFGITIDELVRGEAEIEKPIQPAETRTSRAEKQSVFPPRKIVGTVLLSLSLLVTVILLAAGGGIVGLVLSSPLILCGIICFVFKKNIGLWCSWAVFFSVDMYLRVATGTNLHVLRNIAFYIQSGDFARIIIASAQLAILLVAIAITVLRFRKIPLESKNPVLVLWAAFVLLRLGLFAFSRSDVYLHIMTNIISYAATYTLCYSLFDWLCTAVFTAAATFTVRWLYSKKR